MEPFDNSTNPEPPNRKESLAELQNLVRQTDAPLVAQNQAIKQLNKLEQEQALFSPKLDVLGLTETDFAQRGLESSPNLKAKMQDNDFYEVGIPVTLFPKSGWAFTRLECSLEFCPNETDRNQLPIIYEIFPDDVWAEIFRFQDSLTVGLDQDFRFRTQVEDLKGKWQKLSSKAQGKLSLQGGGGANLVVGPFSYRIRRAEVIARGRLAPNCRWRLDGKQYVAQEDVLLKVILMVPKSRKQPVNAVGRLKADHDFQVWSADIFKDYRLEALWERSRVIETTQEWKDILASSRFNPEHLIAQVHDSATGRIDALRLAELMTCSEERMAEIIGCDIEEVQQNPSSERLQANLAPVYSFVSELLELVKGLDKPMEKFRMLLNAPERKYLDRKTPIKCLIEGEFDKLDKFLQYEKSQT